MLYLWVRATANWEDERAFSRAARSGVQAEGRGVERHIRHALPSLSSRDPSHRADQTWRGVESAAVLPWDEIPDGALSRPSMTTIGSRRTLLLVLERANDAQAIGYFWTSSFVEVPINLGHRLGLLRRALFPRTPPRWILHDQQLLRVKSPDAKLLAREAHRGKRTLRRPGRDARTAHRAAAERHEPDARLADLARLPAAQHSSRGAAAQAPSLPHALHGTARAGASRGASRTVQGWPT